MSDALAQRPARLRSWHKNVAPSRAPTAFVKFWVLIFLLPTAATASAGWREHPSVHEEYDTCAAVFIGEVIGTEDMPEPGDFIRGTVYTLRVREPLRQHPKNR